MESYETTCTETLVLTQRRQATSRRSKGFDQNHLCAQNQYPMVIPAEKDDLRVWNDMLVASERPAEDWSLDENTQYSFKTSARKRQNRFYSRDCTFGFCVIHFGGAKKGLDVMTQWKAGSKHQLDTDANRIHFAVKVAGADCHDITIDDMYLINWE
ncbi:MAG: hypothetical protein ACYSSI_02675 [Planctomycetota bacterium]|jgi:hypothetical protein